MTQDTASKSPTLARAAAKGGIQGRERVHASASRSACAPAVTPGFEPGVTAHPPENPVRP